MALMSAVRPEDELQAARMAAAAPSQVQHPMHAMIAPLGPPAPEPAPFSGQDMAGMSPDAPPPIATKQPKVRTMSPMERYEQHLVQKQMSDYQKDENPYGSENNHPGFFGKLLHGLSVATGGPNRRLASEAERESQIEGTEKNIGAQKLQQAQTEAAQQNAQSQAELRHAQAGYYDEHGNAIGLREVTPDEAKAIGNPGLTGAMLPSAKIADLVKQTGINQSRVDVAGVNALSHETIAKLKPEQRDDRAIAINQKLAQGQPITLEEESYLKAYAKYIDQTKIQPGVARAVAYGQFRPVGTVDPATGNVIWDYSGHAIATHAAGPQSMNFRTATGMAKFMTSGKGGQTITAYNTANDHLDLLGKAMDALDNGDVQALNQLNNSFKQQFGSAAPTNVNAVKAMLAGELANVAKVTGATDQEIQEQKENINRAASPEQIKGFIETNHDLMDQKAYEMYQQYQQGMQGQPAFNTGLTGRGPTKGANGPQIKKFNPATGRLE